MELELKSSSVRVESEVEEDAVPSAAAIVETTLSPEDIAFLERHGVMIMAQKKLRRRIEKLSPAALESYKLNLSVSKCVKELDIATGNYCR